MLINRGQQPWLLPVLVFMVQQTSNSSQDYQVSGELLINREDNNLSFVGEPVWPSGKALGWEAKGPRFDTASALLTLQKGCGLWTLPCDFVHHFLLKH